MTHIPSSAGPAIVPPSAPAADVEADAGGGPPTTTSDTLIERIEVIDRVRYERGEPSCVHWLIGWIASTTPSALREALDEYEAAGRG